MNGCYSQPDFYHFSDDATFLARYIITRFEKYDLSLKKVLDIGCGSGVIGLEVAQSLNTNDIVFIELQSEFIPHLEENIERFSNGKGRVINTDINNWEAEKGDIVFANPPYFIEENSRLGTNKNRNKCRLISKENYINVLNALMKCTNDNGCTFFLSPLEYLDNGLLDDFKVKVVKSKSSIGIFELFRE